jgi:hypothetical protein
MIWDCDLTLTEEYQQLPLVRANFEALSRKYDLERPEDYENLWSERRKAGYSDGLNYMGQMLNDHREGLITDLSREELRRCGARMQLASGMPDYLRRVKERWQPEGVDVKHFIVSAGIKPIIEGSALAPLSEGIFAGEFEEKDGKVTEVKSVLQPFQKTAAIIQIAKGDKSKLDTKMDYDSYAYSYRDMIVLGDGFSDVPPMAYTRQNGATCVCVYKAGDWKGFHNAKGMTEWAHWLLPRDFSEGGRTEKKLDEAIGRIVKRGCDFPPKLLHDFRNGRLKHAPTREFVEAHTSNCPECPGHMSLEYVMPA